MSGDTFGNLSLLLGSALSLSLFVVYLASLVWLYLMPNAAARPDVCGCSSHSSRGHSESSLTYCWVTGKSSCRQDLAKPAW
jgi:hypothetical protein